MEKITTSLDQNGRMLIPAQVRERFSIEPGDQVILEINNNELKIKNVDHAINEMHNIFTKNQDTRKDCIVEDFLSDKHKDVEIERNRDLKNE